MPSVRTMVQVKSPLKLSLTTRSPTGIFTLPDDILLLIIGFVGVKEILTLRKTSKRLYSMTKLRWVWSNAIKQHVIDKGLPVPAAEGIKKVPASAVDLESRTVHAAKFHENWYSSNPTPRRTITFYGENFGPIIERSPVKQVLFLPGKNGQYLVTVSRRMITCWEVPLDGAEAYKVAEWTCTLDTTIEKVIVNEDSKSPATLACICGHYSSLQAELNILCLDIFHGTLLPKTILRSSRDTVFPLHAMRGDWIVFGDPLLIWCTTSLSPIRTRNLTDESKVLAAKFIGSYLLVVRQASVQLLGYDVRDKDGIPLVPAHSAGLAYPAKEAVIVARTVEDGVHWPSEPVSVIMRCCDDGFDTIRQYDLPPNPKAQPFSSSLTSSEQYGYPCLFPLHYTCARGVAPSASDLLVGQNGKGLWMETRNVTSKRSVYPARCLVGFDVIRSEAGGGADKVSCGNMDGVSNELHVSKNELFARRCDMSEILSKRYAMLSADLEDSVGRVAIGYKNGKVEVLDYV
ncbi:hypothetical protein BXZ70DRAFT_956621 [Cristinia sonorae]|uniref:F-box domain-containing protein n=1 Tax=Cristinia sonorae TaxID=1940300 RepID=A0A8K0XL51_9AGAR|nr:hypothetical protein BXZ70DRAFT_956621 [Cristinia sonorae]